MARSRTNTTSAETKTAEVENKNETKNENTVETKPNETEGKVEPLENDSEIEVESLLANVSYYDEKTGDRFQWDNVGDIVLVPFEVLKNMHRKYRNYFLHLLLKPKDDRVIEYFKLNKVYSRYEKVLDVKNFTSKKIDTVCDDIKALPNALKFNTFTRIQNWVSDGSITEIKVIRRLEQVFGLELYNLLDLD